MEVRATTANPAETDADTIAVGVFEDEGIAHDLPGGALAALLDAGEARRSFKHLALVHTGDDRRRYLLVGLGERSAFDGERARVAGAVLEGRARELGAATLCWEVPHHVGSDVVRGLVEGTMLHAYRFDRYKPTTTASARRVGRLLISAHHDVSDDVDYAATVTRFTNRARDLANTPSNDLTPPALAEYAAAIDGVDVTVLDAEGIGALGMGAFLAVARGSVVPPRLIRIDYDGTRSAADAGTGAGRSSAPSVALIGKAITFDAGGLAIKPAATMHEMKFDMAGGAAVLEAMAAIAALRLPVRVMALIGAAENLPSGTAVKPGDIVSARDGTTIEVNNPDAEGRLVLGELISYAISEGAGRLVDLATLTGAVVTALGSFHAGLFANDDTFASQLLAAAAESGEPLWRLPLHPDYAKLVVGRYAQLTNRPERREAMAITAAEFLHHFAGKTPWAHLDIAGTAYDVPRPYYVGKGATGFGVRLLVELIQSLAAPPADS